MQNPELSLWLPLSSALGIGLLIGLVRERVQSHSHAIAGLRTHALTALAAAVAASLGQPVLLALLLGLALLALAAYHATHASDPGLTSEITLLLTALLGALAIQTPALSSALAVIAALLLYAKAQLHRLSRQLLSEREVFDGLLLLAAALVVLPLLPNRAVGPWQAINPAMVWKLVVLVMAISALGHVALRLVGTRWGLPLAGFFAGYVSSTAAVIGFGQRVRESPTLLRPAVAAALLSNLASLSLSLPILWAVSPALLQALWPELCAIAGVLLGGGLIGLHASRHEPIPPPPAAESRMFRIGQALSFAALLTLLGLITAALSARISAQGAMTAAILSAILELHAAVATLAQQAGRGLLQTDQARWLMLALLTAGLASKSILAVISGGRRYGLRVSIGLLGASLAGVLTLLASR